MSLYNYAYFQIAAKAIVKRDDKILVLVTPDGYYDFPGGRMDETEVQLSLEDILRREILEELGSGFVFDIKSLAFVSKRGPDISKKSNRILATFFEVDYVSGEVELSEEHTESRWIYPKSILGTPEKFASEDEYLQYQRYYSSK